MATIQNDRARTLIAAHNELAQRVREHIALEERVFETTQDPDLHAALKAGRLALIERREKALALAKDAGWTDPLLTEENR